MTKQELLTKLATECATWQAADGMARWSSWLPAAGESPDVLMHEWLAERERLLNKPSWKDAPDDATHLAMDGLIPGTTAIARWYFYTREPAKGIFVWLPVKGCNIAGIEHSCCAIAIPAGYDWRDSLEARPVWIDSLELTR